MRSNDPNKSNEPACLAVGYIILYAHCCSVANNNNNYFFLFCLEKKVEIITA